jgi:PTS system N-acetylgalactosamine-specific IIA component
MGADALADAIGAAATAIGAGVIFTDLPAGSCTIAARRLARANARLAVVTGTNLAMLLEFALKGDASAAGLDAAAEKGRLAIQALHAAEARGAD